MQKIKIILLKNSYNKQRNYTWCSYQKLFLSFRTTTGELYMQECQTIWSSIVVNCTFDTFFELAVAYILRCSLTSSSGQMETGSLHCSLFYNSTSLLETGNIPKWPIQQQQCSVYASSTRSHHVWHWVFSETNFKISYCVNMLLIVRDIHCTNAQIRLTDVVWLRRTKPVRTAPTANCFWHSGMNRPVLNWPCDEPTGDETTGNRLSPTGIRTKCKTRR